MDASGAVFGRMLAARACIWAVPAVNKPHGITVSVFKANGPVTTMASALLAARVITIAALR